MASRRFLLVVMMLMTLLGYQNCEWCSRSINSPESLNKPSFTEVHEGGGQPYDGKPFILDSQPCPDGTAITARILLTNDQKAYLTRVNCQDQSPQELANGTFNLIGDGSGQIQFNGETFQSEVPPLDLAAGTRFYTQLTGDLDLLAPKAPVYFVDLFETPSESIQALKAQNIKVICNFSAGTYESYRPDADQFPAEVIGNPLNSALDERYLNINAPIVRQLMLKRFELAKTKGCVGVDLDNMNGFANSTGFNLTQSDQVAFNAQLAYSAHDRRLLAGFHGADAILPHLVNSFDFAYGEECFRYNECQNFMPFIQSLKSVFLSEYTSYSSQLCSEAKTLNMSLSFFNRELDGQNFESCQP